MCKEKTVFKRSVYYPQFTGEKGVTCCTVPHGESRRPRDYRRTWPRAFILVSMGRMGRVE
jgi:hypothetical protein